MRNTLSLLCCVACALLKTVLVFAGETVELRIETVLATNATNTSPYFDTRLEEFRSKLDTFPYKSYRLVQEERRKVGWGTQVDFSLPGGRTLQVVPKHLVGKRIALKVILMEGTSLAPVMNTALSIKNHGMLFFGGRRYQDGILIIRIGAAAEE
jgi:hypothetical protein